MSVIFRIEVEREMDGRWLAEVVEPPGVLAYGAKDDEAFARAARASFFSAEVRAAG